ASSTSGRCCPATGRICCVRALHLSRAICSRPGLEIKDPLALAFLSLMDENSKHDREEAPGPQARKLPTGTGGRLSLHRAAEAAQDRRRVVSHRPAFYPPPPALPGRHRAEDLQVHPWRLRAVAPLPELWLARPTN